MAKGTVSARVYSVDAVRGFAIFAMIVAHTDNFTKAGSPKWLLFGESVLNDVAAPLFALVMGVSIALTAPRAGAGPDSRGSARPIGTRGRYRWQTAIKAAVLIVLGFALEFAASGVDIVLDYLGATLLVALPFLFLRTRWLLVAAASFILVGPPLVAAAQNAAAADPTLVYPRTALTTVLQWLLLGYNYRVVGLIVTVLIGIAIGRAVLGRPGRTLTLLGLAAFGALATQLWKLADLPGADATGGYVEILRDVSLSVGAFTVFSLLLDLASARVTRISRTVLEPIAVQGRLSLSVYVVQILVLIAVWASPLVAADSPIWTGSALGWVMQLGILFICWAFAFLWWTLLGTGPIERVIGVLNGRHPWASLWATRATKPARPTGPTDPLSEDRRSASAPTS